MNGAAAGRGGLRRSAADGGHLNQRCPLADVAQAHRALQLCRATGSSVLLT
jgi:hypothetical protein